MAASAPTKQQQVYEVLRERILSGAYGPGFRVVIDQVAAEFAVSALPVREAIRRLEAEGLIVYRPNAGAQVAPAEPEIGVHGLVSSRDAGRVDAAGIPPYAR